MPKRGTIVLIPFPFTDLTGAKVRPALVVSQLTKGEDMVVAFISSKVERGSLSTEVKIMPTRENGLKVPSTIRCMKIATLEKKIAIGERGVVDRETMKQVDRVLKRGLGL